jgi:hypothetical protein
VQEQSRRDDPNGFENQKQLSRNDYVGDEQAVGDTGEHLRPRQSNEKRVALEAH